MTIFKIPYYIENGGDGSAILQLCKTIKEADKFDESQSEGFAESTSGEIKIVLREGGLFVEQRDLNKNSPTYYQKILVRLEPIIEKSKSSKTKKNK